MMNFANEFRQHWKALLAAALGLSMGLSIQGYINSIFAPHLIKSFQWSRADFALTSMVSSVAILCIPIAGRMTDRFGVRPVATVGMAVFPLTFVGMSLMTGSIYEYVAYNVIQLTLCVTTSATVYSRIVAERFTAARGTALAVLTCGPALSGAGLGGQRARLACRLPVSGGAVGRDRGGCSGGLASFRGCCKTRGTFAVR